MGAVGFGALAVAALALVVAGFVWQAVRRSPVTDYAEYVVEEAVPFVYERLSDRALARLDPDLVRRILDWNLQYTQVVGPRSLGRPPIVGGGEGIEYVMTVAGALGLDLDPLDIAEIMAIEIEYLLDIGAIGTAVEGGA